MASGEVPAISVQEAGGGDSSDVSVSPPPRQIQSDYDRLSPSPDWGGSSFELPSSASSDDSVLSEMAALEIPLLRSCELRSSVRDSLGTAAMSDPIWKVNRISTFSEDFDYITELKHSSQVSNERQSDPSYSTSDPDNIVALRLWRGSSSTPKTVPTMFKMVTEKNKKQRALALLLIDTNPDLRFIRSWTYEEYYSDCIAVAKAFIKYGLEAHHSVCILGRPSPTWHIANMAAIMAGGKSVGIDRHSSSETCLKIVNHCSADIIVVDKPHQLEKILRVISEMTSVKKLVYSHRTNTKDLDGSKFVKWEQLLYNGRSIDEETLDQRMDELDPASCCSVIYTTDHATSTIRGAMLSHDNITWSCKRFIQATHCKSHQERVLSHMSLADINYQMMDIYAMIASGGCCYFVPIGESVTSTLPKVKPTMYLLDSIQWDLIACWIKRMIEDEGPQLKDRFSTHLSENFNLLDRLKFKMHSDSLDECVDKCVKQAILRAIGLKECRLLLSLSTDPMSKPTCAFLKSMGLPLWQQYGTAETTGPVVIGELSKYCMSSGKCYSGTKVKFEAKELLVNSRQVFMGYLHDGPAIADVITDSCWLKTGVCGSKEGLLDSSVTITGVVKDLITLSSGEKVAPLPLENLVLRKLSIAGEAYIVGEGCEYLTCLILIKVTGTIESYLDRVMFAVDPMVTAVFSEYLVVNEDKKELGHWICRVTTLDDFTDGAIANVLKKIMKSALEKVRRKNLLHSKLIRRIALLRPKQLIGPKLARSKKREYVSNHFGPLIEELYKKELTETCESCLLDYY